MKIVVLESLAVEKQLFDDFCSVFQKDAHEIVVFQNRVEDPEILIERIGDADIAVLTNIPISRNILTSCKNLKMLAVAFTGFDHIDIESCDEFGITVSNAAGFSTSAVAELTIAMALNLLRNIIPMDGRLRNLLDRNAFLGENLRGKTFGIIGTGLIGTEVARLAAAFGCKLIGWSRSQKPEAVALGINYLSFKEVCQKSDILSIHLPLNDHTRNLFDASVFMQMKNDAILINTARGPIVDNAALADALKNGVIAGAALDVYEGEPPLQQDHIMLDAPNTLLLPHIAYASKQAMNLRLEIVQENIAGFINGKPMRLVNHPGKPKK